MSRTPHSYKKSSFMQPETGIHEQLRAVPGNIHSIGITDSDLVELLTDVSKRFLTRFHLASQYKNSPKSITDFEDACKRRFSTLLDLVTSTGSALADNLDLKVIRFTQDGEVRTYKYKYENRLAIIQDDDPDLIVFAKDVKHPACYTDLFRAAYNIISSLSELKDSYPWLYQQGKSALLYLVSIGKIYEGLRGNTKYNLKCEQDALNTMQKYHELDHSNLYTMEILNTLNEISEYCASNRRPPHYLRDIVNAIRAVKVEPYNELDYHVSLRSTGLKKEGCKLGIPGLLASLIETGESQPEDEIIGYQNYYQSELAAGYIERKEHTISIEQSKLKRRVIHIASNAIQDRCNYFHKYMAATVRQMRTDCTFNQTRGVEFALKCTDPEYRAVHQNSVYSADISDATGTVNQQYQKLVLQLLFGEQCADWYMRMATGTKQFFMTDRSVITYQQTLGQPQGFKGSFPLFAMGHHILLLTVMRLSGLEHSNSSEFYRIIGDDVIMSCHDPDESILDSYIACCQSINWTVHKTKGYYYYYGRPNQKAIAEFAKVTVIEGEIYTPIPIKLLLHNTGDVASRVQLLSWISRMVNPLTLEYLIDNLSHTRIGRRHTLTDDFREFLRMTRSLHLSLILEDFLDEYPVLVNDRDSITISMAFLRNTLKSCLLDQFLPDHLREEGSEDMMLEASICKEVEDQFLDLVDERHKYCVLLRRNQNIIDALEDIFTDNPMLSRAIIALELTPEEIQVVYQVCDILATPIGQLVGQHEKLISLIRAIEKFSSSFQMRSIVKRSKRDSLLLKGTYDDYLSICHDSGLYDIQA